MLEADLPGGEFSADWRSPTVISAGVGVIGGTGGAGSDDYFLFTGLPSGAQTLVLDFNAPDGIGYSYSAGGAVLYDTKPFAYEWAGTHSGTVQLDYHTRRKSITLALPDTFEGQLYLALNFTHGEHIAYSLTAPANALILTSSDRASGVDAGSAATPHVVPLPASGLLLSGVLFGTSGLLLRVRGRPG